MNAFLLIEAHVHVNAHDVKKSYYHSSDIESKEPKLLDQICYMVYTSNERKIVTYHTQARGLVSI